MTFNTRDQLDFRSSYYGNRRRIRSRQQEVNYDKKKPIAPAEAEHNLGHIQESELESKVSANEQKQDIREELELPKEGRDAKPSMQELKSQIAIHVCDDVRKVTKNFYCDKSALLSEMKYFKSYFKKTSNRVDISVHCDIHIFEWLMRYIQHSQNHEIPAPNFSIRAIVSILISSDFLGMDNLVKKALHYLR